LISALATRARARWSITWCAATTPTPWCVTTAAPGPTPQEHVFAQFGSGTLAGAATHLSRFMLLDPLAMLQEEQHLRTLGVADAFDRTTIDAQALVITPFQRAVNRLKELARGGQRHGSCGMGIGETMADRLAYGDRVLLAGDLGDRDLLRAKLSFLREVNLAKARGLNLRLAGFEAAAPEWEVLAGESWSDWLLDAYPAFAVQAQVVPGQHLHALLRRPGAVIFEGAQGVLLDEWGGFHPHTTWSTTTLHNADGLLGEAGYDGVVTRVGITRGYMTRHGAGPLVTEDAALTAALPDAANGFGAWQRGFRLGWLDLVLLRYARELVGPLDWLAVTCLDRIAGLPALHVCRRYRCDGGALERLAPSPTPHNLIYQEGLTSLLARCQPELEPVQSPAALLDLLAAQLGVPVGLTSHGPSAEDKCMAAMQRT
jgi:adenylosuccinate synthase